MVSILGEVGFLKEKEGEVFGSNSEDGEGYLFYFQVLQYVEYIKEEVEFLGDSQVLVRI